MSWLDQVVRNLVITTGDGLQYIPNWINASKTRAFNVAEFEFPDLEGTLVKRGTPKGARYNLEIYFQGEDHIDIQNAFEKSSFDKRYWKIQHPIYGELTVQPLSIDFDNSNLNVSKINVSVVETIIEDAPKISLNPRDKIAADKKSTDESFIQAYDEVPSQTDVQTLKTNNAKFRSKGISIIKIPEEAEIYFNLFNTANSALLTATTSPLVAIRAMQAVIAYPSLFTTSAQNRVNTLIDQFTGMRSGLSAIGSRSSKKVYENNGGILISSMALSASTPQDRDYGSRTSVYLMIGQLLDAYNTYIDDLDSLQTDNGATPESYTPDFNSLYLLNALISYTISNLFDIAMDSKLERTYYCEDDTNVLLLVHRFYGLDEDDANIDLFIAQNNIGLNEILQIRKGRKIVYYT